MKPWLKISLALFGLLVLSFAVAPFIPKTKREITKGTITRMWIVPAHLDKRLHSPGVWEQAWIDTQYWMEIQETHGKRLRVVEVMPGMFKENFIGKPIKLGDSLEYKAAQERAAKALEDFEARVNQSQKY